MPFRLTETFLYTCQKEKIPCLLIDFFEIYSLMREQLRGSPESFWIPISRSYIKNEAPGVHPGGRVGKIQSFV